MWDETNKPLWLRWDEVGQLNRQKKFEDALRKGKELLEKYPTDKHRSAWGTLAESYRGLGLTQEAEAALQEGLRRYPQSPHYCQRIGTLLAQKSAGNPEFRQAAIVHWKNAMHFARIEDPLNSAFDDLKDEIEILSRMPPDEPYPPIDKRVPEILSQLQSCGLFEGRDIHQLARELGEIHPSIVRPDKDGKLTIADFLSTEERRYLLVDWRFTAEDVLREVATQAHEPPMAISEVTDTLRWMGYRTVSFSMNGDHVRKTVPGATGLIGMVNRCLRKNRHRRTYFQAYKWTLEAVCHFLLLSNDEAKRLRAFDLIPISRI